MVYFLTKVIIRLTSQGGVLIVEGASIKGDLTHKKGNWEFKPQIYKGGGINQI